MSEKLVLRSFVFVLISGLFLTPQHILAEPVTNQGGRIRAFVSIAPQAFLVERIGGSRVNVSCMVGPGQSPATYEPRPRQMAELGLATLYFRIGVPFENVWMDRISKTYPKMRVVDTRRGIALLPMKSNEHHYEEPDNKGKKRPARPTHKGKTVNDPHIWLSLRLAKLQAKSIAGALIEHDPRHKDFFLSNLKALHRDLDDLDTRISKALSHLKIRKLMVFHPAWGYFSHDYGLDQIPIEIEGKEPTARSLARLIKGAKEEGIKVIFVQKQFSKRSAQAVADAIGGRVIQIDPLAKDYLNNMRKIADSVAEVLQ
jgi:zinc transport system substrate-binding protein